MTDPRITKLAENLINNAIALKQGENILIETTDTPDEVTTELVKAVAKVGGNAFVHKYRGRVRREMIKSASIEQMKIQADLAMAEMQKMQVQMPHHSRLWLLTVAITMYSTATRYSSPMPNMPTYISFLP